MEVSGRLHALAASRQGENAVFRWIGNRVGSRVVLDALKERKFCSSNPWTSVPSPTAKPTTLSWLSHLTRSITSIQSENSAAWEHLSTHEEVQHKQGWTGVFGDNFPDLYAKNAFSVYRPGDWLTWQWPPPVSFLIWTSHCISTNNYIITVNTTKRVYILLVQHDSA